MKFARKRSDRYAPVAIMIDADLVAGLIGEDEVKNGVWKSPGSRLSTVSMDGKYLKA